MDSQHDSLKERVAKFPKKPGVYLMRDAEDEVIYVGKAKDLRARVKTYFTGADGRYQIEFLMRRVEKIETIVSESEQRAFLLERDLISKYKPRYNIRLKDDKAYLSIRIDENEAWPRLTLVRKIVQDGARYFGPYTFSYELRNLLEIINRTLPLRTCSNTIFYNRQRPCLEYQIKRCAGPCCLQVDPEEYRTWVKHAMQILEGKTEIVEDELEKLMNLAAEDLRFEDASLYRDRLELLKKFKHGAELISSRGENRDVFAIYREEKLAALSVLMVRNGRVVDNKNYSFPLVEVSNQDIIESSIEQFYGSDREIPEEIIIGIQIDNLEFQEQRLKELKGTSVKFVIPKRGIKYRLLGLAQVNAHEHFIATFNAEERYREVSENLAKLFQLSQIPRKIECVDISNLQGSNIVGAHVVFFDGVPDKKNYRRYKISNQGKPDDFSAIYEVVYRRLTKSLETGDFPDLLIIDGGLGQLNAAIKAREDAGVKLELIGLAKMRSEKLEKAKKKEKKPERVFLEGEETSIALDPNSEVTKLLQRIRDEAHRYVITFHRKSRSKRVIASKLDGI
ncbi:MAG: excinuclease ABC subunit UvrC, partial [Bdellovibrionales bacterium]|nr:excinuclease ABC subunit UvrC [Bdellovibrionales bacterium]